MEPELSLPYIVLKIKIKTWWSLKSGETDFKNLKQFLVLSFYHDKWVPVTKAWHHLSVRMEE
jgi:hypothetical protein